ncbi:chordin-like protein 1 [Actinia tenebrosa]|uniref:Chordin-like protein 1 n=1 Tax=Actinia tenebrosa TaxID=6105 RepID=A0A6P8H067_ACTTE|nr:chordin-like protein 1 [Actinia tenebrosa]
MRVNACLVVLVLAFQMSRGIISPGKRVRKANSSSPALHCTFNTVKYNISQTWYPLLLPYGYFSCIKCVCEMSSEGAKVVCKRKECKKLTCANPHIKDGECCKKCPGSSQSQYSQQSASSCSYMGRTYTHGKVWEVPTDNSEPNQCTDCSCSDGFVSCAIRTCPKQTCSSQPVASPNSCCKVCPSQPKSKTPYKPGCWSLGRHYQEGEKWHPLLDAYKTKCIICVCKNSSIRCRKIPCDGPDCIPRCCENCHAGSKVSTKVPPMKTNPVTPQKPAVPYPDCNLMGVHKHNTSWTPIVADSVSNCIKCECLFSKVRCSRISCPSSYPCANPVVRFGECCKFCEGLPNRYNKLQTKLRHCGSAKSWNVYEYVPKTRAPSIQSTKATQQDPQEIRGHFVLESVQKQKIEIHTLRANRTHKTVRVKAMYRTAFKKNMSPWMTLKPIGVIRDGRRRTIEEKEKRPCRVGVDCRKDVKALMRMVRIRSRRCRAVMTIPPISLLWLSESL